MAGSIALILAIATWYAGPYVGEDLYCGGVYDETARPWVAVDVALYESGAVRCGDLMAITFEDGQVLNMYALDAGPFGKYWIEDWPNLPIMADLPKHLWPIHPARSAKVSISNITANLRQELERVRYEP